MTTKNDTRKFIATFHGRQVGAIGIRYGTSAPCQGTDENDAIRDLYNRWEHISDLVMTPVRLTNVGEVIIHPTGVNPYDREPHPYRIGDERKAAIAAFRDFGTIPDGYSLWDDRYRKPITTPAEVDWAQFPAE